MLSSDALLFGTQEHFEYLIYVIEYINKTEYYTLNSIHKHTIHEMSY